MKKTERQQVYAKTCGHCAYCGTKLPEKGWQLDHVIPVYRGNPNINPSCRGTDSVDNALPACPRCNRWKSAMTLEQFRREIEAQCDRLRRDSAPFRLAEDYGRVERRDGGVKFYFETMDNTEAVRRSSEGRLVEIFKKPAGSQSKHQRKEASDG